MKYKWLFHIHEVCPIMISDSNIKKYLTIEVWLKTNSEIYRKLMKKIMAKLEANEEKLRYIV